VPPSAWMTSQSMMIVRSPRTSRSVTARSDRPIRRWISWVLPEIRPASSPVGCGFRWSGQHGVFGRHPAGALAFKERRRFALDGGRRRNPRLSDLDEGRAVGVIKVVGLDFEGRSSSKARFSRIGLSLSGDFPAAGGVGLISNSGRVFQRL